MEHVIEIRNLTRDYGRQKGIFDVNIEVKHGEVYGFLGPNGAGKTTTIRHLMGFIKSKQGSCRIMGIDCFKHASIISENMGYLAGEVAFPEDMKGIKLVDFVAQLRNIRNYQRIQQLMEYFELDPQGKVKKMSKGMKQKIAIICAFMDDPQILILDEPTSGLDPLMQNKFIDLVLEEKKKGKTILMSSHIFEEVERTCDRCAFIRKGKIVAVEDMNKVRNVKRKHYDISFADVRSARLFVNREPYKIVKQQGNKVTVLMEGEVSPLLISLSKYHITDLDVQRQSLEDKFLHLYGGEQL